MGYDNKFSEYYDTLYSNKDYEKEVGFIEDIVCDFKSKKIVDIGCGTGSHSIIVSKKNPKFVLGIDIAEAMIEVAKKKSYNKKILSFVKSDISDIDYDDFDIAISMFNVINHIHNISDLSIFLKEIRNRLKPGGAFIFDVWNGIATILDKPRKESRNYVDTDGNSINVKLNPEIDLMKATVNMKIDSIIKTSTKTIKNSELVLHTVWTPKVLNDLLNISKFEVLNVYKSFNRDKIADENDYKIVFSCVAI